MNYEVVFNTLDQCQEHIDSLLLADKLSSEQNKPLNKSCRSQLERMKSFVVESKRDLFRDDFACFGEEIKKELGNRFESSTCYTMVDNNKTACTMRIYNTRYSYKNPDEYEQYLTDKEQIIKYAIEMEGKIINAGKKFRDIYNDLAATIENHELVKHKDRLKIDLSSDKNFPGSVMFKIVYCTISFTVPLNLVEDIDNNINLKEKYVKVLTERFEYQMSCGNQRKINEFLYKINDNDVGACYTKESELMYDFKEGYINENLDVENKEVLNKFLEDVENCMGLIKYAVNADTFYFNGNVKVKLGTKYLYNYLESHVVEGNIYDICESAYDSKNLLLVYKNGTKITGRQRRKIINLFGYGRKKTN